MSSIKQQHYDTQMQILVLPAFPNIFLENLAKSFVRQELCFSLFTVYFSDKPRVMTGLLQME